MAGSSIGAALLPSISKAPLAEEYGSSGLSARPKVRSVSEMILDNTFLSGLTSKGGKGITAPLSARGMGRHRMREMLFFDHIVPTVVLVEVKVRGFRSALLLATQHREHRDHDDGDEGDAADGDSDNGPW